MNLSTEFTPSKSENVFSKVRFGLRVGTLKTRGALLQKDVAEGVSPDLGRRIALGRLRLDCSGERGVGLPELEEITAAPWPDLAGGR